MRDDGIIKVSRSLKELSVKARGAMDRLSKELGIKGDQNTLKKLTRIKRRNSLVDVWVKANGEVVKIAAGETKYFN